MSATLRWSKLKIKSKHFSENKKNKPQFKGEIFFVYDIESLVIHHFYIQINSCVMSKLVTKSHREAHEQCDIPEFPSLKAKIHFLVNINMKKDL